MLDLSVKIGDLTLKNPIILASGTCGYGQEIARFVDLNSLGGVVLKGVSLLPRKGNPPPRIHETPCGLLNSIGLSNVGIDVFVKEILPKLSEYKTIFIANILGNTLSEYVELVRILNDTEIIKAIELNLSCPNVKCGGISIGTDPKMVHELVSQVRAVTKKTIIAKLTPNVGDITEIANACESAGADALSLINTVLGLAIDIEKRRPVFENIFAGLSGPAIKPIALRFVWQAARCVKIPVIGIGGITTWQDAVEFFMAGAQAIQIGTANLVDPEISMKILEGLMKFMEKKGYEKIIDLRIS